MLWRSSTPEEPSRPSYMHALLTATSTCSSHRDRFDEKLICVDVAFGSSTCRNRQTINLIRLGLASGR